MPRLNAKQKRRRALLTWVRDQYGCINPRGLVHALSVEVMPWDSGIPCHFEKALKEFRKLATRRRVSACREYLHWRAKKCLNIK